jgi:hypothetical protein
LWTSCGKPSEKQPNPLIAKEWLGIACFLCKTGKSRHPGGFAAFGAAAGTA